MNHIIREKQRRDKAIAESENVLDARSVFTQRQNEVLLARSYRKPRQGDSA